MLIEKYRHPVLFYALCTAIPWALWFAAAYVSHLEPANESREVVASLLGVAGLFAPAVVAFCLIWPDPDLRRASCKTSLLTEQRMAGKLHTSVGERRHRHVHYPVAMAATSAVEPHRVQDGPSTVSD